MGLDALDSIALHICVVEVQHAVAFIAIGLLVSEVDDDEVAIATANRPRYAIFSCGKTLDQ